MPILKICCGVSGSGKSTYAKELVENHNYREINRDNVRFQLYTNDVHDWSLYKFTKEREDHVSSFCDELFDFYSDNQCRYNIIVSNTNLGIKYHKYWQQKAEQAGYDFEVKYFDVDLETLLKRDTKRGALSLGKEAILQQWKKYIKLRGFKKYVPNEHKPKAVIVDIDGSVARATHRGHHDYHLVSTDTPRMEIISMILAWTEAEKMEIIFMSGRPDSCREDTKKWLETYFFEVPYLYMRKTGDNRNDSIVKEELFWDNVAEHWNIIACVDDRNRVLRKWHDLGIPNVINVQETYVEY